jgi:hypothetical protein
MSDDKRPFAAALHALAEEGRRQLASHPSPAQLAALRNGELQGEAAEAAEEHLALCPSCNRFFLDLAAFPDLEAQAGEGGAAGGSEPAGGDTEEEWAALARRIEEVDGGAVDGVGSGGPAGEPAELVAPGPPEAPRGPSWYRSVPALQLLAAGLGVAAVGLGVWSYALSQRARAPRTDVDVVTLLPRGEEARGSAEGNAVSTRMASYLLVLTRSSGEEYPAYSLEVIDPSAPGKPVIWRRDGLLSSEDGVVTLEISRDFFPPGRYELRLFGLRGAARQPVEEYDVDLGGG